VSVATVPPTLWNRVSLSLSDADEGGRERTARTLLLERSLEQPDSIDEVALAKVAAEHVWVLWVHPLPVSPCLFSQLRRARTKLRLANCPLYSHPRLSIPRRHLGTKREH
jgi:hypothetical protein